MLPPTTRKSNTHILWTERRRTAASEQDVATHNAQIKHSRTVDRTTTNGSQRARCCHLQRANQTLTSCGQNDDERQPVSKMLPPTTRKSKTHSMWTERRRTAASEQDVATHNAQIKHSLSVDRTTTNGSQ